MPAFPQVMIWSFWNISNGDRRLETSLFLCLFGLKNYSKRKQRAHSIPTHQGLIEGTMTVTASGAEAVGAAERSADLLTARAASGDPFAIPSLCRISGATHYSCGILDCTRCTFQIRPFVLMVILLVRLDVLVSSGIWNCMKWLRIETLKCPLDFKIIDNIFSSLHR